MRRQATISLAGKEYMVGPLTVGHLEDITIAAAAPDTEAPPDVKAAMKRQMRRRREVIAVGVRDAEITADSIEVSTEITAAEILTAFNTIMELSELTAKPSGDNSGETAPAAD
jgi:hypothetical protein